MRVLLGLVRMGVVLLLGASAWTGFVAGRRRWAPCTAGFDTDACLGAQSHETGHLPELGVPEGISLLLLGGALLLLALLGTMPRGGRVAALTVGPIYALVGVRELRSVGQTDVPLGPAPPLSVLDLLLMLAVFSAPVIMLGIGVALLVQVAQEPRPRWRHPDLPLALAWLAMVVGWPITEGSLLMLVYASHDAPPGTGLLRSGTALIAAGLVLWHLVCTITPAGSGARARRARHPAGRSPSDRHRAGRAAPPVSSR